MSPVFADTFYWAALIYPVDEKHERALAFEDELNSSGRLVVTTEEVLIEHLTFFSDKGAYWRARAVALVEALRHRRSVSIRPQTTASFELGLALFASRSDNSYSLTDCIAMQTMRHEGLIDVLTNDRHL